MPAETSIPLRCSEASGCPVMLAKQAFTNQDGSTGVLHLASSDLLISYPIFTPPPAILAKNR